jgi:hypothetical protein
VVVEVVAAGQFKASLASIALVSNSRTLATVIDVWQTGAGPQGQTASSVVLVVVVLVVELVAFLEHGQT